MGEHAIQFIVLKWIACSPHFLNFSVPLTQYIFLVSEKSLIEIKEMFPLNYVHPTKVIKVVRIIEYNHKYLD